MGRSSMVYEMDGVTNSKNADFDYEVEQEDESEEKSGGNFANDENQERGNWGNDCEFILSIVGYCVGLGNVWRFPYMAFRNGGGAFLIPYWCVALVIGSPLFLLEVSVGQFSNLGPTACWALCPLFKGLGYAAVIMTMLSTTYYVVIVGWALYYFAMSFTSDLPWQYCHTDKESVTWTNELCGLRQVNCTIESLPSYAYSVLSETNGACYSSANGTTTLIGIVNTTLAEEHGIRSVLPAEQYYYNNVLGEVFGETDFENIGGVRWQNALCLLAAWCLIYVCLINGIKTSGKVVYFTALFPYVGLSSLLINGFFLEGGLDGMEKYVTPDFNKLQESQVWLDAGIQVFYSLGPAWGSIIALSSYNKFHNNVFRDSLIAVLADTGSSMLAGLVIFCYLGHMSHVMGVPIDDVAADGPGLTFIMYPTALALLPAAPFWSCLFFFTFILIGLGSAFNMVQAVSTSLLDHIPWARKSLYRRMGTFGILCVIFYISGLVYCTPGADYIVAFMDNVVGGWQIIVIATLECVAVSWFYGWRRFTKDIATMVSWWKYTGLHYFYGFEIVLLTPTVAFGIVIWQFIVPTPLTNRGYIYPDWANDFSWAIRVGELLPILIFAIVALVKAQQSGSIWSALKPTREWGPAIVKFRRLIDYVPGFVVDPWSDREGDLESVSSKVDITAK